jgi:hypothetical protein
MKQVVAIFVLHLLTDGQNNKCVNVWWFAGRAQNDPQFLTKVVTGDESWYYSYDLRSKQAVKSVDVTRFPQPRNSAASSLQYQDNVDFWGGGCWWDLAQWVCSSRTSDKSTILLECGETIVCEPATKMSREVAEWGLVLAPWQCPRPHSLERPAFFLAKNNGGSVPPPPLGGGGGTTWPHSLWLCFVSTGEAGFERKAFRWRCWGSVIITSGPWQYFHWRFSAKFPAVGAALGSLDPVTGGVLWRGLKFQIRTNTLNKFFCNNSGNFWVLAHTLNSSVRYLMESTHHNYPISIWQ